TTSRSGTERRGVARRLVWFNWTRVSSPSTRRPGARTRRPRRDRAGMAGKPSVVGPPFPRSLGSNPGGASYQLLSIFSTAWQTFACAGAARAGTFWRSTVDNSLFFSADYFTARERFRAAARARGLALASYPLAPDEPWAHDLTIDVAQGGTARPARVVVVS